APTVCSLHWRSASPDLPTFGLVFKDTSTTEIDTLSLHDALPICDARRGEDRGRRIPLLFRRRLLNLPNRRRVRPGSLIEAGSVRSEEHTSELQSRENLVCRLLLEKKKLRGYKVLGIYEHDAEVVR